MIGRTVRPVGRLCRVGGVLSGGGRPDDQLVRVEEEVDRSVVQTSWSRLGRPVRATGGLGGVIKEKAKVRRPGGPTERPLGKEPRWSRVGLGRTTSWSEKTSRSVGSL